MKSKVLFIFILFVSVNVFLLQVSLVYAEENIPVQQSVKQTKKEKEIEKKQKEALKEAIKEEKKAIKERLKQEKKEIKIKKKKEKEIKKQEKLLNKEEKRKLDDIYTDISLNKISLVLDYDLNFRAALHSNIDYTLKETKSENILGQYLSVNLIGKFDERLEMGSKISAYGLSGKYDSVFDMPYYRDTENDFSVFLENAFLAFKNKPREELKYIVSIGKQGFQVGDGLIFDDNFNGKLGIRGKFDFFQYIELDMLAGKDNNKDFDIFGAGLKLTMVPSIEIGIYQEKNNTGYKYDKGIYREDPLFTIEYDHKTFYDLRVVGGSNKYGYKIELAQQTGELKKNTLDIIEYDAMAFVFEGSWKGKIFNAASGAKLLFSYSGADGENSFNPTFSRRYNGLQRIGYGTLFAAGTNDSFFKLPDGYYGINTIGVDFDIMPWEFLQTGLGFFLYSATDAPVDAGNAGLAEILGAEADLGNEIDFFVKYKYRTYFDIAFNFAMYTPPSGAGKVFANSENAYLFQIELGAKF